MGFQNLFPETIYFTVVRKLPCSWIVGISTTAAVAASYKCEYESAVALCIPDLPTGFFIAIFRCDRPTNQSYTVYVDQSVMWVLFVNAL